MKSLHVFNFISLDGYFAGLHGDIGWHSHDATDNEPHEYGVDSLKAGNTLLFGRVTYQMMSSYWPSPQALENDPVMAKGMNEAPKLVVSRTLKSATWDNTRLLSGDLVETVRQLKQTSSQDITILGSGSLVTQLSEAGLIDSYQFMLDPIALGAGRSIFHGMKKTLRLRLTSSRVFKQGQLLLVYTPA
ncbi:MAG TPA: dihydrofolate reductase family protein [Polyangiales bacterium]|nr:dihydrofolate reductase family protein [Polyangiales bacterium]